MVNATALTYGAIVTLDSAVSNADAPVIKQAAVTDNIFGVIAFSPVKAQFAAGDRVAIARANDIVWLPAAGAIAQVAKLYFNSSNKVTSSATAGHSIVGRAITSAAAEGDFVQVELGFETTVAPST